MFWHCIGSCSEAYIAIPLEGVCGPTMIEWGGVLVLSDVDLGARMYLVIYEGVSA